MRRIKTTMAAACAALALTAGAAMAQTQPSDRTTHVTFSGPVSIPGMTLPAGTYTFRIMDSNTDRHIVEILDRDGMKLMTTLLAVPAERMEATGDPIITFKETPSDRPPAVHFWYYAGDKTGNELIYPKNQAQLIANASGESVMSVDSTGTSIDDWKSGKVSKVNPDSSTASSTTAASTSSTTAASASSTATTTADTTSAQPPATPAPPTTTAPPEPAQPAQPTTAPIDQTAQPATAPPPAPSTPETVGTSGSMPKTASELPIVGLVGLLALIGAAAVRAARTA